MAERTFEPGTDALSAAMSPGQELIVMLGPPIPLHEKAGQTDDGERRIEVARLSGVSQLPTHWYGYEGVDLLILSTTQPDVYRSLSGARLEALEQWVRLGGQILLSVGSQAGEILAAEAPLARFAPGRFEEMIPLRSTSGIEAYAEASDRLDQQATAAGALSTRRAEADRRARTDRGLRGKPPGGLAAGDSRARSDSAK